METRYCHGCRTDVEIVDGYCLLGHAPRAVDPQSPLADIRAEVDRAFSTAQVEVAEALQAPRQIPGQTPAPVPGHGAAQVPMPAGGVLTAAPPSSQAQPDAAPPQAPRYLAAPPPPPAPIVRDGYREMLKHVSDPHTGSDPITAFAPPPRMDWGPERFSLFRLRAVLKPGNA